MRIILDDYHFIPSPVIHKALSYLLDHQPPQMHLTLTTLTDPSLPLAQFRAREQLTELRQADLRFSDEEAVAFLKQGASIELSSEDIHILVTRTKGWIGGLQMADLSMRNLLDFHLSENPQVYELASPVSYVYPVCPPTLLIAGAHDLITNARIRELLVRSDLGFLTK